ncbi:hypothetical protein [Sediminitomix flava]|uniref:Uncharacterized protein n=1 Tax=Sediminitomix flava TaxID=379075 RepID=A0A315ZCA2_SEDFL|nr:hypothetical protein [Sediminitomix flava]PWJ43206.1 hypothetical protein BC781_102755 [Sediminitomix flava]
MTEELKAYEKTIKKKSSFSWSPKYEEITHTKLQKSIFIPIVIKTFEKLGWDVVFVDELIAEAKYSNKMNQWTEKITVSYEYGKAKVISNSLGSEVWDNGRNSKRVKLFIHALQETEKEYDQAGLEELEKEVEREKNWDDYEVPESLPQPQKRQTPQFWIPVAGGLITATLTAFVLAFISIKGIYIIGLFELGVAMLFGFVLKFLIQLSTYTKIDKLSYLLMGMVGLTYVLNQYFQYHLILNINNYEPIGFLEYMKVRLSAGLLIKSINTGWIGLLISWAFQLWFTYTVGNYRLAVNCINYIIKKVPEEVVEFATYHFIKDKTEDEVRTELRKMGWSNKNDQEDVFEALGAIQGAQEIERA